MDERYILLDCLHDGPVNSSSSPRQKPGLWQTASDLPPHPWSNKDIDQVAKKYRNISEGWRGEPSREFMREMIHRYGTCAILAWRERSVVGHLRFYPLTIAQLLATSDPVKQSAPAYSALRVTPDPRTLWVQCVMTSQPYLTVDEATHVHARKGVGQKLVEGLKTWARAGDWTRIVKYAHADITAMYGQYGGGGKAFWKKAGFRVIRSDLHGTEDGWIRYSPEWRSLVESQAQSQGMDIDEAWSWHLMAYDL